MIKICVSFILSIVLAFYLSSNLSNSDRVEKRYDLMSLSDRSTTNDLNYVAYIEAVIREENKNLSLDEISLYSKTISKESLLYNFDPYLILSIVWVESKFDNSRQSEAGAIGLMQILPSTAEEFGVSETALKNPQVNISLGVKYLDYLRTICGGDLYKTLSAYNYGIGNVLKGNFNDDYYNAVMSYYFKVKKY